MVGQYVLKFNSRYCLLSLSNRAIAPHIHLGLLLEKTPNKKTTNPQKIAIETIKCLLYYNSIILKEKEGTKHEHAKMVIYLVQKLEFHGAIKDFL